MPPLSQPRSSSDPLSSLPLVVALELPLVDGLLLQRGVLRMAGKAGGLDGWQQVELSLLPLPIWNLRAQVCNLADQLYLRLCVRT